MKNQDVEKNGTEIFVKHGLRDSTGNIVVPADYDYLRKANENLFVGTNGSLGGLRYVSGRILCAREKEEPYGVVFNRMLKKKQLDTQIDIYTMQGKLHLSKTILAAFVCPNEDMLLLLDENYKWSIVIIDYINNKIIDGPYVDVDLITMEYKSNTFIIKKNEKYIVVSFNKDNTIAKTTQWLDFEPFQSFKEGIVVKKDDKYGFMDYDGEMILGCQYDSLLPKTGRIETIRNYKEELYTYTGHFITCGDKYLSCQVHGYEDMHFVIIKDKKMKYCLYSPNQQLLPCEYSSIEIYEDFAIVSQDEKYGLFHYDSKIDKMIAVHPIDYPDTYCSKMSFIQKKNDAFVEVKSKTTKKKYLINLEEERNN